MSKNNNLSDKKIMRRRRLALLLCVVMLIGMLPAGNGGTEQSVGTITTEAATETHPYYFFDGTDASQNVDIGVTGGEYKLKTQQVVMTLQSIKGGIPSTGSSITLTDKSMDPNNKVVYVQKVKENGEDSTSKFMLIRKGPGYETVEGTVRILEDDGVWYDYTFSFWVRVDLNIDRTSPQWSQGDSLGYFKMYNYLESVAFPFKMMYPGLRHQIRLSDFPEMKDPADDVIKYDYRDADLTWSTQVGKDTENYRVVTVDKDGYGVLTAKGAGLAEMSVTANNEESSKVITKTLNVVVPLLMSTTRPAIGDETTKPETIYKDFNRIKKYTTEPDGEVVLYTTAYDPLQDMTWEITDMATNKDASKWFDLSYESMEETRLGASRITIKGAKAGTYRIRGYMKSMDPNLQDSYADLEVTIPVNYKTEPVWMNVGDKYNLFNNTNIPDASLFAYVSADTRVAEVNSKGVITAKRKGSTTIYAYDKEKYSSWEEAENDDEKVIKLVVHVVDTLSLNTGEATIPVGGTLNLFAQTTDVGREIVWTVEDDKIVSIEADGGVDALITGLKQGETKVWASQTINGVEKSVSCLITVVPEISKVEVTPPTLEIDVKEYAVLKATVTPAVSTGTKLHWVSSDSSVVALENPENRSTTCSIVGVSPGTAVVMAINKNNIVVGSSLITVLEAPTSVVLSEHEVEVPVTDKQYQLQAKVLPTNATNKKINWKSSNPKIATVDENGLVKFVKHGTVTIIAASDAKPELTDMCELTITEGVSGLVIDDTTLTLNVGDRHRLTYEVLPETAYDRSVTFTSMDTKVAVVDSTGLITAKKAGTTYVTVTTTDGGYSKVCTVTVKQSATTIKLDAAGLVLDAGESYTLDVSFNPKTTTETTLRWSSNNTSVAKVDSKGRVTGVGAGDCVITVVTSNNLVAFCYVTVNQAVTGIKLDSEEVQVAKGKFVELKANVLPKNATDKNVTWKSSNEKIAQVSDSGTVKGISGGSAIITCTTDEGGFAAVCMVTVIEKVAGIKLNKTTYKLGLGKKFTLTAKVTNSAASDPTVTWVSSDPKICAVNKNGVISGKKLGYATITAYANDGSEAEASCEVRVVRQATGLTLNTSLMNMIVGDSSNLKATIRPKDVTYKKAKYSSSDTKVAIVDSNGKVTAVGAGTCNITVKPKDNSGLKAVCVVIVRPIVAATGITLNPNEVTLGIGGVENVNFSLKPNDSTDKVTWSSNNKAVATVGKTSGTISAKAPGTTVVTATTSSGKSANVKVTVVGLNYASLNLEQYDTYTLRVMGVTSGIVWDVDNPDICTVVGGRVTAKKGGTTYVVARVNGAELRCRVRVTDITH